MHADDTPVIIKDVSAIVHTGVPRVERLYQQVKH
jgi:hypothetical protein